ncbi:MAG: Acetolactate synthase, small subunit [Candidatus Roizmanbacteria bacterium GW2011_GWA2_37_7]|uniref:Acetolactate synthase small subunit n=1 Tax=Candidatus Roizmanbacteria bacterium GW2011_GWA2_37_7 TaxID=1618481 RepID=A0A0G0H254_9BACT|nr:MAG: Acetolactate synthase, small subunit [Candidatus Roizmanbacteria bacterium GW2011_GWA2_37_7]
MKKLYTITAFTENKPGVLYRIADLFLRRKINIESLTVSEVKNEDQSRFTIVVYAEASLIEKIVKQLYRIIEVVKVIDSVDTDLVAREIALLKVSANKLELRKEIEHLAKMSSCVRIIEVKKTYLVLEKTGTEKEINDFYELMKPFGIKEFVQSGRIAVFTT